MSLDTLTPEMIASIKNVIDLGAVEMGEIAMIKESLKDKVESLAKELDVKPKAINTAIKLAYKEAKEDAIAQAQQDMSDIEIILHAAGRL